MQMPAPAAQNTAGAGIIFYFHLRKLHQSAFSDPLNGGESVLEAVVGLLFSKKAEDEAALADLRRGEQAVIFLVHRAGL